jgi:AP-4 complex subunit sigma-1
MQCSFFELRQYKIVYRRYASLFFMVGVDQEEVSGLFAAWLHMVHILA